MPLLLLQDHAKHVVFCQGVLWGPAGLLEGISSNQEIGSWPGSKTSFRVCICSLCTTILQEQDTDF